MYFRELWIRNRSASSWMEAKLSTFPEQIGQRKGMPSMEKRSDSKRGVRYHEDGYKRGKAGAWNLNPEPWNLNRWTSDEGKWLSTSPEQIGEGAGIISVDKTFSGRASNYGMGIAGSDFTAVRTYIRLASDAKNLVEARRLHTRIIDAGLDFNSDVGSAMVSMFVNCGSLSDARDVFDKLPCRTEKCWTGLISGYVKQGENQIALVLYQQMQEAGVNPTPFTFCAILKACGGMKDLAVGRQVHQDVIRTGCELDPFVGPALVTMYAKSGSIRDAQLVFNDSPQANVFLWNTMIGGYAQNGYGVDALKLFERMQEVGVTPNKHTYVHILRACGSIGALGEGQKIHASIRSTGLQFDPFVGSALVEMYAEYGQLDDAMAVFHDLPARTVGVWNKMIRAYGQNDNSKMALKFFKDMQQEGVRPDGQTFIALLVACSHQGLVSEAQQFFKLMMQDYGITPTRQHYICLADVLGRSGHLCEAEDVLEKMPFLPTVVAWTSLLSACSRMGEVEIGRRCFDRILEAEPSKASSYLLMSRLYESVGMQEDADRVEKLRRNAGARNYPASVLVQSSGGVHEFLSGSASRTHPLYKVLQEKVRSVTENMRQQGFDVEYSGNQSAAEELSVAEPGSDKIAVMNYNKKMSANGSVGTIVGRKQHSRNRLRMCGSCHQWVKALSLTEKQAVIVRDGYRTHHFKDGQCSCGSHDYQETKITFCGHSERLAIVFGLLSRTDQVPDTTGE